MSWRELKIDAGFGGGEETQRFGPRNEQGSSLYQVDTVACISPNGDEELTGCPPISSVANQAGVCLVVANNVLVFDEHCSSCKANFSFASNVDCVAWVPEPSFLAIAQSSGVLSFVHVPSKQVILSQSLLKKGMNQNECFRSLVFCPSYGGTFELDILPCKGPIIRLQNIDLESVEKAIDSGNTENLKTALENISPQRGVLDCSSMHSESLHHIAVYESQVERQFLISGKGEFGLSVWKKEAEGEMEMVDLFSDYFNEEIGFVKCLFSPNEDFFIALDTKHHVTLWSTALLTPLHFYGDVKVQDFMLFSSNEIEEDSIKRDPSEELKLVILTMPENKKSFLQVYSLPNFDHVYTLQVSGCSRLATFDSQLDSIYFIEGIEDDMMDDSMFEDDNNNDDMDISTIRLRCLTEALPYSRFLRLLHKHKFDQAEEFAKQFDLDVEVVFSLKAAAIINSLDPESKLTPRTEKEYAYAIRELKNCLNMLTDASEIVNFCLNAALPTSHATFDLLKYGKEKLESKDVTITSASNFQSLLDGLNRLVTFEVAFGAKSFTAANWASFLNASLLDEVMSCFKSHVAAAIVIWRRHQPELEDSFTLSKLESFLASIPDNIPSTKIIQWLREDFVPFILTKIPEGQMLLAKWLDARARHMEISEKENWPQNALELAEVMFKAFSDVAKSNYGRGNATPAQFAMQVCRLSIPCSASDPNLTEVQEDSLAAAMARLGDLVTSLREVSSLHAEFACKLSLHGYQQENVRTIAFRLLDRVLAPELIPGTVERYVRPYAAKHNLLTDDLLLAYVNDLVQRKPGFVTSMWHSKVISVIECIADQECKCTAAMQIMSTAATPWRADVKQLADAMMKAYPQNESLRQLHSFAELKATMLQYGIRDYSIEEPVRGNDTIHYIFQCDTENALKDAKQVIDTFQTDENAAYFFRIKSWITKDKVEECCNYLRSLNVKFSVKAAEGIKNWAIASLEDPPLDEEDKELCTKRLRAAVEIVRTVSSIDKDFKTKNQACLRTLQNIIALQVEFDMFLSYEEYTEPKKKNEILMKFLLEAEEKVNRRTPTTSLQAIRLADLLGVDQVMLQRQEISALQRHGNNIEVLRILRNVRTGIPSRHQLRMLKDILLQLSSEKWHPEKEEDLFQWLTYISTAYRLAAFGTAHCNEDDIRDYLQITQCLRLASLVSEQCESTDYRQDALRQTDAFAKWNLTERYEDEGIILYSHQIVPLLRMYYKSYLGDDHSSLKYEIQTLSGCITTEKVLKNVSELNKRVLMVLMESHMQTIALQFLFQIHGALFQNMVCGDAGFAIPEYVEAQVLSNQEINMEILKITDKAALDITQKLFVKVLTHRQTEHSLALGYLAAMPYQRSLAVLASLREKFANKYRKMEVAALVGVDYAGLKGDTKLLESCQHLQNAAYWGRKFVVLKIPFDDVYKLSSFDVQQKTDIVKLLATNRNVTINTIKKFCQTFTFDEDVAFLTYIQTLLLPQRGSKEDPAYKEKVLEAVSLVTSSENLYEMLHSVLDMICPYDYERISLVLSQMSVIKRDSTERYEKLLDQLYSYERCSPPSEYEFTFSSLPEDEQLLHGCANILPESSKVRLPFHALIGNSPWKIFSPELRSERAARKLENVAKCLKLDTNKLYATTVHNIVNDRLQLEEKTILRSTKARKANFRFEEVKGLIGSIIDPELALAAAQWVAKFLPLGEEKVKVLKACVQLCKASEKTCSAAEWQKLKELACRLNDLCRRTEIEVLLLKYGINDEEYRNMAYRPEALIESLYEFYGCKGEIVNGRVVGIPNIHEIAEEIANVSHINLTNIHFRLLEKWLPSSKASGSSLGDTTLLDVSIMAVEEGDPQEDENNLKRVIYILNKRSQVENAEFLMHFVFKESSTKVTHVCRIRAIQALFALVSGKIIESCSVSECGLENMKHHLTSLVYLAELDSLHLPQSLSDFNRCDKAGLVRGLWRNHSHEPKGARLIADLCLDYQIYDIQLWNILLPQLLSFGLVEYLRHTLVVLSAIPGLREIPCLSKMWRSVILAPFSSVSIPLSEDEEDSCLEAANLLQRCPVILDLSMQDIALRYQKIGMLTQAVLCLTLIPEITVRESCLERLVEDVGCFAILEKVEREKSLGKFQDHLDRVQEEVFSYINKNKMYKEVATSGYFQKFVTYLASTNQLNDLIMETITSGRFNNAVQLVQLYEKIHPSSPTTRSRASDPKGVQRLVVYLQDNNLFHKAAAYFPDCQTDDPYSVEI